MHAIEITRTGGPDVLTLRRKADTNARPTRSADQSRGHRRQLHRHVLPDRPLSASAAIHPGSEVSRHRGRRRCRRVTAFQVGDRVASADAIGAYAEYCIAPVELTAHVPDGISFETAASALLKGLTAHFLIKSVYPVQPGDDILLHAGAGGVGLILTQWAASLGARVITTVSTPQKAEMSRRAGAADVLDYPTDAQAFGDAGAWAHRTATAWPRFSTASASRPSMRAWQASPFAARWRCSAPRVDRCHPSTRSG